MIGEAKTVTIPADRAYGARRDELVLDANHPLAGKDLTFDIRLVAAS